MSHYSLVNAVIRIQVGKNRGTLRRLVTVKHDDLLYVTYESVLEAIPSIKDVASSEVTASAVVRIPNHVISLSCVYVRSISPHIKYHLA